MRLKKLITTILACATVVTALCAPVLADTTRAVIDDTKKGTLVIHKLLENDGRSEPGNGISGEGNGRTPMQGIRFTYLKIGDIVTGMKTEDQSIGTYYYAFTSSVFLNAAERAGYTFTPVTVKDGNGTRQVYTSADVQKAMDAINRAGAADTADGKAGADGIREIMKSDTTHVLTTGADGSAKAENLDLGLYLVCETDASGWVKGTDPTQTLQVENLSDPFLVSLPMTNTTAEKEADGNAPATAWQYTVHCYPKNSVVSTEKWIVSQDDKKTLKKTEDWEMGEIIKQVISSEAPAVIGTVQRAEFDDNGVTEALYNRRYKSYRVMDDMSSGMTFAGIEQVLLMNRQANPADADALRGDAGAQVLEKGTDYLLHSTEAGDTIKKSDGTILENAWEIVLTEEGLSKLNALTKDSQAVVFFDAYLNEHAKIGEDQSNWNQTYTAVWHNNQTAEFTTAEPPQIRNYTYELDLVKQGLTKPAEAKFEVKQGDRVIQFVKVSDGVYRFATPADKEGSRVTQLSPAASGQEKADHTYDGRLIMKGFDDKTYTFTETATQKGHDLLKTGFTVTFSADTAENPTGALSAATASFNGTQGSLKLSDGNKGIANITVSNSSSVVLHTGGSGRGRAYAVMAGLIAAAALAAAVTKKRKHV